MFDQSHEGSGPKEGAEGFGEVRGRGGGVAAGGEVPVAGRVSRQCATDRRSEWRRVGALLVSVYESRSTDAEVFAAWFALTSGVRKVPVV